MRKGRLIISVISTLLDEFVILFIILWGLPMLGIRLPIPVIIIISLLWAGFAVLLYITGNSVMRKKPVSGLTDMTGLQGIVIKKLEPEGIVKIGSELWIASSSSGKGINQTTHIIVKERQGLKLIVKPTCDPEGVESPVNGRSHPEAINTEP